MAKNFSILVVDDEKDMRESLKELFEREKYEVEMAGSGNEALQKYKNGHYNLVISDIVMPGMNGIELLESMKQVDADATVIMITGYATIENAVRAIKIGAEDYFTKPFKNVEILKVVNRLYNNHYLTQRAELLKQVISQQEVPEFIGQSREIKNIRKDIKIVAGSDVPVFITGESGTGKEIVARAIHNLSSRRNEPFVPINCAAVPKDLLESEFFGHEKGAFSGALSKKFGLFEVADRGTLFLDEIGEMPFPLQAKILRTVETKLLRRIGGTQQIEINIRIISSTNRDIQREIKEQRFREDLYFRLSTFTIHIPPLRERKSDIPLLINHYLNREERNKELLSDQLLEAFLCYNWPGNVRELENVIDRLLLITEDIPPTLKNLPLEIQEKYRQTVRPSSNVPVIQPTLKEVEKAHIFKVLRHCNGDKKCAADVLGIGLKTLYRKLAKYEKG